MSVHLFLADINGIAELWAADGQFLGLLSNNKYDAQSISNLRGIYGSQYGLYSIRNIHGMYGGTHGLNSPYNPYCKNPPIIFFQDQAVLMVTTNTNVLDHKLPIVDPDFLLGIYTQGVSLPIDRLNYISSSPQNHLKQATATAASMF